jgi:hypothetical protein
MSLPETLRFAIAQLTLTPGDILVVKCEKRLHQSDYVALSDNLKSLLPGGTRCIILDSGISLEVLTPARIEELVKARERRV